LPVHIVPKKIYYGICATLLVLTFATYRIALVNLGRGNVVVALTIAFAKATLVALFFMHVRYSVRRTQLVVVAGIFWLGILMLLTMSDYLTRGWLGRVS
jgi:cytochrome c oxidase subunit 4